MEQSWEKEAKASKERKELQKKYPLLGKKVRRKNRSKWEEGIIVLDTAEFSHGQELFIEYSGNDSEQLLGLPFQIWDDSSQQWIDG